MIRLSEVLANAPFDDVPETEAGRQAVEETSCWLESRPGQGIPYDEAMRQPGLE